MQQIKHRKGIFQVSMSSQATQRVSILRNGGLYRLPDGAEFVAGVGRDHHHFLYHPRVWAIQTWIVSMPVAYEVTDGGQLLTGAGEPTTWSIIDLVDTDRTAERLQSR